MKVFISYSHRDKKFVDLLVSQLQGLNIEVFLDKISIKVGENIFEKIEEGVRNVDYILVVISPDYLSSGYTKLEYDIFNYSETTLKKNFVIPLLIRDCQLPLNLANKTYIDFRKSKEEGFERLQKLFNQINKGEKNFIEERSQQNDNEILISKIRKEYVAGNLTLFCGAGISIKAGIPDWGILLKDLLSSMFEKKAINNNLNSKSQKRFTDIYYKNTGLSSLIIGQYLKNGLGVDFLDHVRSALYKNNPKSSDLIDIIVELCRPQRERKSLHSIVSFNFDDLIEVNLENEKIKHYSIFKEGQRSSSYAIPVYHVHGFLPRNGKLTKSHDIVFSEDAYHSQFIEPFSWSNLIQLNHLNQNSCLFVGTSLTDPNLRRLLDVSIRKNPDHDLRHFIFKKRLNYNEISTQMNFECSRSEASLFTENFIKVTEILEEQDANKLGLNIIWVDDYSEIPTLLNLIME